MRRIELAEIEEEIEERLEKLFGEVTDELDAVLGDIEERVRGWLAAVVSGELSLEEFKGLVEGEKDLGVMLALEKEARAKEFANGIKNVLLETVVETVEGLLR